MTTSPFSILRIDHVVIRARDIAGMLAFYRDVLGCTVEREVRDLGLYQLRAGDSLIDLVDCLGQLGQQGGDPPNDDAPNMDHLCIRVDPWDANAISAYLISHGAEPGAEAQRNGAEGVGPSIYLDDPEGNTIELKGPASQ